MEPKQTNFDQKALKSERFISAVDYLIESKRITGQKELAELTGINESTFSNIRNKKKNVTDKTIYKLLDAFPGIFNSDYFRLKTYHLLADEPVQASEPAPDYVALPTWADALIQMVTEQVKANEEMRRELRQSLEEVAALKQELQNTINNLKS
jgi:transcriptional regulator with XRE-family HTH domain